MNISRNCDIGKHRRCLGTVLVVPTAGGERIAACECQAKDCPHAAVPTPTGAAS